MKILYVLLLIVTKSFGVEQTDVVETYSNEMPKKQLIWKAPISKKLCLEEVKRPCLSPTKTWGLIRTIFKDLNFQEIELDPTYWTDEIGRSNILLSRGENNFGLDFSLLLDVKIFSSTLDPDLDVLPCKVHQSVLRKNKWDYPRPMCYWNGDYKNVNEMSWSYVDLIVHSKPNYNYQGDVFPYNESEERLYQSIQDEEITKSKVFLMTIKEKFLEIL